MIWSTLRRLGQRATRRLSVPSPRKRVPRKPVIEGLETRQLMAGNLADTIGGYRPDAAEVYLRNSNTAGRADVYLKYDSPYQVPLMGDWDGDGVDTIGIYRPAQARFNLRNDNTSGGADISFTYGNPGDVPIAGDWDGDGIDTIGVYRSSEGRFYLRNSNTAGNADVAFTFGSPGWTPIAGDWNGDGIDTVGAYVPSHAHFYLRNSNTTGNADLAFTYGNPGWTPIAGDWNGDGVDTIGAVVPTGNYYYLRNSNTTGYADIDFAYGDPGWIPLAGRWQGDNVQRIGSLPVAGDRDLGAPDDPVGVQLRREGSTTKHRFAFGTSGRKAEPIGIPGVGGRAFNVQLWIDVRKFVQYSKVWAYFAWSTLAFPHGWHLKLTADVQLSNGQWVPVHEFRRSPTWRRGWNGIETTDIWGGLGDFWPGTRCCSYNNVNEDPTVIQSYIATPGKVGGAGEVYIKKARLTVAFPEPVATKPLPLPTTSRKVYEFDLRQYFS